jgi:peptidoglycan/LPS O-acetylase OafA/YrhL
MTENAGVLPTKPHYAILDGLRGVAAVIVVLFHTFEAHAESSLTQIINHGYLAVDFFFVLSGFVIGYAYDDRWHKLTLGSFFKRRLQRLQPMVIMGMVIGAICFYFGDSSIWPAIHTIPVWKVILTMLIGFTLIPVTPSMDIRGWQEMHPLNGPGWSLFFEYIANILYAVGLRKLSKKALSVLVILSAALLVHYLLTSKNGDVIGGWSVTPEQLRIGFTRLFYPFFAGLLLSRVCKPGRIKHAFLICSLLICVALAMPRLGGDAHRWLNGLYEAFIIIIIFPLVVYVGASGFTIAKAEKKICKFLGDISYPLYITHYAFIYIYTGWASDHHLTNMPLAIGYGALTVIGSILVAYLCLKYYDEPVRAWLKRKWK